MNVPEHLDASKNLYKSEKCTNNENKNQVLLFKSNKFLRKIKQRKANEWEIFGV